MHQRESRRNERLEQAVPAAVAPTWKDMWRELSQRQDGGLRPIPDEAEAMVMRLKQLEEGNSSPDAVAGLRNMLQRHHQDVVFLEGSAEYQCLSKPEQKLVNEVCFAFRTSSQEWEDVAAAVASTGDSRVIASLIARELWSNRERYLFQSQTELVNEESPLGKEVLRFLSESFSLLRGEEASILAELAHELYRTKAIGEFEYAQKLSCYSKAPGALVSECSRHLSRAREVLPERVHAETEAELFVLGQVLGVAIRELKTSECIGLLEAPYPVIVGLAPAFIRKQAGELPAIYAVTAIEQLCYQLEFASSVMQREQLAYIAGEVRDSLVDAVKLLPPIDAQELIETAAPVILSASWWSREAGPLWNLLTEDGDSERSAIRTGLLKHVLRSPSLIMELSKWIEGQVGYPWFEKRLEGLAGALGGILVERYENGEKAVTELEALQALRLMADLGKSAVAAAPQVGALMGVPVVNVWFYGPVCLPWGMRRDESPAVLDGARYVLHVIASHARGAFGQAISRRGL
jgi:hypothetical protein